MDQPTMPPHPPAPQQPPNLVDVINALAEKADPIVKLLTAAIDKYQRGQERKDRFRTLMVCIVVLVTFAVVGIAGFLTYRGKIDGGTFSFLLGLIVGSLLTFIRDQVTEPK
jgi:uncharacterized membrane protein